MTVQVYNDPVGGSASTIGTQIRTDYHQKKALIELKKEQYFSPMADVTKMPKNFGKKIKLYHYMPLLDDRNVNDQGIDAAGVTIATTEYAVFAPRAENTALHIEANGGVTTAAHAAGDIVYSTVDDKWYLLVAARAIGANLATSDTLKNDAAIKAYIEVDTNGVTATVAAGVITLDNTSLTYPSAAAAAIACQLLSGAYSKARSGNLYGSSKDIGAITSKLPALSETGGRVNRVGFKRIGLEGTFEKFGFFEEYTQESLDFDTDDELESHINREMLFGANEMTEDALQIDLLNAATTIRYAGAATSNATVSGVTNSVCEVDYDDLSRLSLILDDNRTPKHTKVVTGSRMIDTKTIPSARFMYIGSELVPTIERIVDHFSNAAFIPIQHYASSGDTVNGEIGTVGPFRVVVVPEMLHWAGAGAMEGANAGYRTSGGRYNVYPMLVIGEGSFTTIGFYTDGKSVKFKIYHKKPGQDTVDKTDPYGESGLMSIKWYYGFMALRAERLGLIKTVARV